MRMENALEQNILLLTYLAADVCHWWRAIVDAAEGLDLTACILCHVSGTPVLLDCLGCIADLIAACDIVCWGNGATKALLLGIHACATLLGETRVDGLVVADALLHDNFAVEV